MIRILLVILALLAVPFLIYGLYELIRRGPDGSGARHIKDWERDSVLNMGFVGLFLATAGMITLLIFSGGTKDGDYIPARFENGKLIDGRFNEPGEASERGPETE